MYMYVCMYKLGSLCSVFSQPGSGGDKEEKERVGLGNRTDNNGGGRRQQARPH